MVAAVAAWFLTDPRAAMLLTLLVPLVWVRHHENIARLLKGTEPKIGQRSKARGLYFRRVKPSGLQSSLPTP